MTYVRREFPEKSWSVSRNLMLEDCTRKYYYHYYGAHNGWERDAPALAKHAYRLKQLTNVYLVLGDALHEAAAKGLRAVREGRPAPTSAQIEKEIRDQLNAVFLSSRDRHNQFLQRPKHHPMMHEMYYQYGLSQKRIDEINHRISVCVPNLLTSKSFQEATSREVAEIHRIDQLDTFDLDGTKVYAVPDLLYRRHTDDRSARDGALPWVIVDWKTGTESEEHIDQTKVYALYAIDKLGLSPADIVIRVEYLMTGRRVETEVTEDDVTSTKALIRTGLSKIDALLEDKTENRPRPVDDFPLKDDTRFCPYCNFYELCRKELESAEARG